MLKELQEKRRKLANEIAESAKKYDQEKKSWLTEEDRAAWTKLNADYDANLKELEAEQARETEAVGLTQRLTQIEEH